MTLTPDYSNIASVPFVAMALQTQEEINASYMRKMNRDYSTSYSPISPSYIGNIFQASESHLSEIQQSELQHREQFNQEKRNEQESS